jgi:clan AA aspartic protease (TIGR02281 family)
MKNIFKFSCCQLLLFIIFSQVFADTLKLKNGRSIEGIIREEDAESLELEVGSGLVKFSKNEIADIFRSSAEDLDSLRDRWQRNKLELDNRLAKQKMEEESKPRKAVFSHDARGMTIGVTLNNKVEAEMVLDTGASLILITRGVAKKLGIDLDKLKPDMKVSLADGRSVDAARIVLDNVKVENSEIKNVAASVLMEEKGDFGFGDGLLGMSFLKNFNFKIDQKEKRLILEKL